MSQKLRVYRNRNNQTAAYGKYYVQPVYGKKAVTTQELADFIQAQCTVKRSDCKAVLDELGAAMKHFFERGERIRLDGIGQFKVGVKSAPSYSEAGCTAANVRQVHVIFSPETKSFETGEVKTVTRAVMQDGNAVPVDFHQAVYRRTVTMLADVEFELIAEKSKSLEADQADSTPETPETPEP